MDNNYWNNQNSYDAYSGYNSYAVDREEIEQKMITRSFLVMFAALLVTAGAATYVASNTGRFLTMLDNYTVLIVAELIVFFGATFAVRAKKAALAGALFTAYSICTGVTLSVIFYAYELKSIQYVFLVTAGIFGVMAVIGATTKVNLTSFGMFLTMFLLGAIVMSVVNMFVKSSGLDMVLDYVVIAIFMGFTAYDTQKLKRSAAYIGEEEVNTAAIYFGMDLYLDFINMFLRILALFGKRK